MSETRVPAGVPTGGQFATSVRNEAEIASLVDDDFANAGRPEPSAEDLILARYKDQPFEVAVQPQSWQRDHAVDAGDQVRFDIAPMLASMNPGERERIIDGLREGDYDIADEVYLTAADMGLVQAGFGPFEVEADGDEMAQWDFANPYDPTGTAQAARIETDKTL